MEWQSDADVRLTSRVVPIRPIISTRTLIKQNMHSILSTSIRCRPISLVFSTVRQSWAWGDDHRN